MTIKFIRNQEIVYEANLSTQDPLTLLSYEELSNLQNTPYILFIRLICMDNSFNPPKEVNEIYYYKNILKVRYAVYTDSIVRYKLLDPITRLKADNLEFYASEVPLTENSIIKFRCIEDGIPTDSIVREMILNELDFVEDDESEYINKMGLVVLIFILILGVLITLDIILSS